VGPRAGLDTEAKGKILCKPVSISRSLVTVLKVHFFNSSNAFHTQEWFHLARNDALPLSSTSPLVKRQILIKEVKKAKAVPLHATEALGWRGV
jgi:hypothetical protein